MMAYMKLAQVTFYYRNKTEDEVIIPLKDLRQHITRIIDRNGILIIQNKKIDLTFVEKITIEFGSDLVII